MNKELEITIRYDWLPAQQQFHESKAKFRAYIGGIGAGKTYAGCMDSILYQALEKPGSLGVIVAPTYPMLRDATMRTFFAIIPREIIKDWTKNDAHLQLINGSEILFRSADNPDRLRGPTITWFYIDEAAYCKAETWDIMIGRLREAKYDRAGFVTGTPRGFNWVYEIFAKTKRAEYEVIHARTVDNTHLPQDYIESLKVAYTGTFALQELGGVFVAFEGLVYPDFNRFSNIVPASSFQGKTWKQVVCGVDFGWTNPTAFVVIGQAGDGTVSVLDEIHRSNMKPEDIVASAKLLHERWHISKFFGDPSSPDYIDLLNRSGIIVVKANNAIFEGIAAVNAQIKSMNISDECQKLIWELERYHYPEKQEGKSFKEEPVKVDDHACFIANTKIETTFGAVPIEYINIGDLILTRKGYYPVIDYALTDQEAEIIAVKFSDGTSLKGTPNHPIWVKGEGFKPLDTLRYGDIVCKLKNVATHFKQTDSNPRLLVLESVQVISLVREKRRYPVYNLTVDIVHEYFANRILVSNCDALRYAVSGLAAGSDTNRFRAMTSEKVKI